jgi:cobalamin biosynthesis protein CbiD
LTATFEEKLREGSQEETYHHGRQGIGTSRSALVVQQGRERIYPFTSKWLKSSVEEFFEVREGFEINTAIE